MDAAAEDPETASPGPCPGSVLIKSHWTLVLGGGAAIRSDGE